MEVTGLGNKTGKEKTDGLDRANTEWNNNSGSSCSNLFQYKTQVLNGIDPQMYDLKRPQSIRV